jgi:hypothetical protein
VHEGDYVTNATYDIKRGKELAHGCVRGLQFRNHLTPFDLLNELLQGPVKNDVVAIVVVHVFDAIFYVLVRVFSWPNASGIKIVKY